MRAAGLVDRGLLQHVRLFERPGLLGFLFHSLFEDRRQIEEGAVYPQEGLTTDDLRRLVEYFLDSGYEFVSVPQILNGLAPGARYVHISFDDGYANNLSAVDILETFEVPATIFVTTDVVQTGRSFWWDALYRERRKRGCTDAAIDAEMRWLKARVPNAMNAYVEAEFGSDACQPVGEVDRPLTPDELVELARNRWITIGNHTKSHAILPALGREELRTQLDEAQTYIENATGCRPDAIAYPNGDYDAKVLEIARACGFRVGLTADPRKNRLTPTNGDLLSLGRYVIRRDIDLIQQLRVARSDLQLANFGRRLRLRLRRQGSSRR